MNKRRNVLLITTDQQHWMTLGLNCPDIRTPHLDRLASMGTLFQRAYTCNPTCTPARASILTGQYPSQHGAYALGTKLPENAHTVGEDFRNAGYGTALIGKAHFQQILDHPHYRSLESNPLQQQLDFWRKFSGPFYGFEHIELCRNHTDEAHVGQHYALWLLEKGLTNYADYFRPKRDHDPRQRVWELPESLHYNRWVAERTCARLDQYVDEDKPFFLWASFPDPHPPYLTPEPWASMYDPASISVPELHTDEHGKNPRHFQLTQEKNPDYSHYAEPHGHSLHGCHSHAEITDRQTLAADIAVYYGMISFVDECVGTILQKLDELELTEDTLVVFTSDHGHLFGQHGMAAKGPFHYEDLIKVPLIIRQPGTVPAGRTSETLQSLVDFAPTFLSACGLPVPMQMTGLDEWNVWNGERDSIREHVVVENRHNPFRMNLRTYVNRTHKLTLYCEGDEGELFDLENDPCELNNLWHNPDSLELKCRLLGEYVRAELMKETLPMPRVASA